jgi:hypothetical protein
MHLTYGRMESAQTFADCEYPILQRFWDSVGKTIPEGRVEPEPTGNGYEIFESTQTYRSESDLVLFYIILQFGLGREARLTLRFDREDDAQEDVTDEPVEPPLVNDPETVESMGQSDTEVEALLAIGARICRTIDVFRAYVTT